MKNETPHHLALAVAATVCELRARTGKSLRGLAGVAGVSFDSIAKVERGDRMPSSAWLWRVARASGRSLRDAGELIDLVTDRGPDTLEEARGMVKGYMDLQKLDALG